jgi:hypothetical protein
VISDASPQTAVWHPCQLESSFHDKRGAHILTGNIRIILQFAGEDHLQRRMAASIREMDKGSRLYGPGSNFAQPQTVISWLSNGTE